MGPTWNEALPTRTVRRLVNLYIDTCGREGGFSCRLVGASLRLRPREPPLRASCLSSNARRVDISPCLTNLLFGMQSTTVECSSVHVTVSAPTHTHTHTRARAHVFGSVANGVGLVDLENKIDHPVKSWRPWWAAGLPGWLRRALGLC